MSNNPNKPRRSERLKRKLKTDKSSPHITSLHFKKDKRQKTKNKKHRISHPATSQVKNEIGKKRPRHYLRHTNPFDLIVGSIVDRYLPKSKKQKYIKDSDNEDSDIEDEYEDVEDRKSDESDSELEGDIEEIFDDEEFDSSDEDDNMEKYIDEELEDLNSEEMKYLNDINLQIVDTEPTAKKIIESNMSLKKQCEAMEKLRIYHGPLINPIDRLNLKYIIRKFIKNNSDQDDKTDVMIKEKSKIKEHVAKIKNIKNTILLSQFPPDIKAIIYKRYQKIKKLSSCSEEYNKSLNLIETALKLPYTSQPMNIKKDNNSVNKFLYDFRKKLDEKLFGMEDAKNEILIMIFNRIYGLDSGNQIPTFVGLPGTGKTTLINIIAKQLNIPFERISMGGLDDPAYLSGHSFTYQGSTPGIIVQSLNRMKCNNGIIFLDEIDKLSGDNINGKYGDIQSPKAFEVSMLLLHVLDPEQNHDFHDKYLQGIPVDLSKIWFILAANNKEKIHPTLRDRLKIINIPSYTIQDKVKIVKKYFIPEILKKYKLTNNVIFDNDSINYLINLTHTKNSGVRQLKQLIDHIVNRIKIYKHVILRDGSLGKLSIGFKLSKFNLPFVVNRNIIEKLCNSILKINTKSNTEAWKSLFI